jgi:hypothetical protein
LFACAENSMSLENLAQFEFSRIDLIPKIDENAEPH